MMREATILINRVKLSEGEAMTIRVAIEAFAAVLQDDNLGEDALGLEIRDGYLRAINSIRDLLSGEPKSASLLGHYPQYIIDQMKDTE